MTSTAPEPASRRPRLPVVARLWRGGPALAGAELAKRRVQVALATLALLLLAVVGISIFATQRLYHSARERYVRQALPLRTATRDVALQMANQETGVLAYVVTHDRASLDPYFTGRFGAATDLVNLRRLTRGEPALERRLRAVEEQIVSLRGYFASQIAFVADGREGQAKARRDVRAAAVRFRRLRRTVSQLTQSVDAFVASTNAAQRRTFRASVAAIGAGGALALAIALMLLVRMPERLRRLYAAEAEARTAAEVAANASRALAHTRDAVVLVDDDDVVRSWNAAAEWLLRTPAARAIGHPAAAVMCGIDTAQPAPDQTDWEMAIQVADAETWVAVTVTAFEGGRVFTIRDVTEAQALERAREDFVATASHELRTPVTSIYGAARTVREHDANLTLGRRNQLLRIMEEESERLTEIVDRILVSAQLDRGDLAVHPGRCDVREICRGVIESVASRHRDRPPIPLIAPAEMEPVETDDRRLRQVLVNIVENACKYVPRGGDIHVRVLDASDRVQIEVTDSGPGIPLAEQERVFEKFYRLDPQMSAGIGGSGLGLYISRQLVERLGGRLSLASALDGGSTFTVELPRDRNGR